MKFKIDFITNSSSASFTILKKHLTQCQIDLIHEHVEIGIILAQKDGHEIWTDPWRIKEDETEIHGYTSMDNFDMGWFLQKIGVRDEFVTLEGSNYGYQY